MAKKKKTKWQLMSKKEKQEKYDRDWLWRQRRAFIKECINEGEKGYVGFENHQEVQKDIDMLISQLREIKRFIKAS